MALKITTQIGTDKGITSEAYVRISDYRVSKYGSADFRVEIFMSQADSQGNGSGSNYGPARNQQIGDSLYVSLTKQVEETVTVKRMLPVEVEFEEATPGELDADGNPTTVMVTRTRVEMQEQDVEETTTKTVPDLSAAEESNIFVFGYGKLKAKLQDLFGEANVVDC
jgi:hypothetical protein